jgi:hypothetical protein
VWLQRARPVRPNGVNYRQQYVRCGRERCRRCPPHGPGHGPYWSGYYWDYRQRPHSFYVGKQLPAGVEVIAEGAEHPPGRQPVAPAVHPPGES